MMKCRQKNDVGGECPEQADFRYTWPGHDESFICGPHARQLRRTAEGMGLYVQLIPLTAADNPTQKETTK